MMTTAGPMWTMARGEELSGSDANPLLSDDPAVWQELIEAVGPAVILVVIRERMSSLLKQRLTPEDVWQETWLQVWKDRKRCEWRGLRSFRRWLLKVVENRIRDAADRETAMRPGGDRGAVSFSSLTPESGVDRPVAVLGPGR